MKTDAHFKKLRILVLTVLISGMLFPALVHATDRFMTQKGWKQIASKDNFKSYARSVKHGDAVEVLMTGVMDAPPEACFAAIADYAGYPDFMPDMTVAKVLDSKKMPGKSLETVFCFLDLPAVKDRYYTVTVTNEKRNEKGVSRFRSSWTPSWPPNVVTPEDTDLLKEMGISLSDALEPKYNQGYWLFEPARTPGKSRVTFYIVTSSGGYFFNMLAEKVGLPILWDAVAKQVKNPRYR